MDKIQQDIEARGRLAAEAANRAEQLAHLVTTGMRERGVEGQAQATSQGDELDVVFTFADGVRCGVSVGGIVTRKRTVEDFSRIAVERFIEWNENRPADARPDALIQN